MYSGTDILLRLFDRVVAHPARCAPCATPVRTRLLQGFGKSASYAAREGSPHMCSPHPLHQATIVGVYNTKQGRLLEGSTTDSLTLEATFGAIADTGISPGEVDGIVTRDFRPMASQLGRRPCWFSSGGASISGLIEATLAIGAGLCETVVIAGSQAGDYRDHSATAPWTRPSNEFVECWGTFTSAEFAMVARRHMHLYGTTPEQLAEVASAIRMNGAKNPAATYYGREVTPADVLNSRMIADPYHLLDICMTSEGGAGMVLTTVQKAKELNVKPVYIRSASLEVMGAGYREPPVWDRFGHNGAWGGKKMFGQAQMTPKDIDVCEFYDNFSWEIIRLFEVYGFCGEGEGGDFVMDGRVRIDGNLPICTDGGLMSFSHSAGAQALQRVIAGVLQIQGRAPNQVDNVRNVLTENFGSGALWTNQMILSSDPAD